MLSWALNEQDSIVDFLARAQALMDSLGVEYQHILIDDGSTDATCARAHAFAKHYPQLVIARNERNLGSGWSARRAIELATMDVFFWQTVDWSYDISHIGAYLRQLSTYDVIQGVRVIDRPHSYRLLTNVPFLRSIKVSKRSDNLKKSIISVTNYLLIRALFRIPILDFQNVTMCHTSLARSIDFETHSSFTSAEILFKAYWKGATILQVPIDFIPRSRGISSGTRVRPILTALFEIVYFWLRWSVLGLRRDHRTGAIVAPQSEQASVTESP